MEQNEGFPAGIPAPIMTASTEDTSPATGEPITVRIGHPENANVPRLSKEQFRLESKKQKALEKEALAAIPAKDTSAKAAGRRSAGRPHISAPTPRHNPGPSVLNQVVTDQAELAKRIDLLERGQNQLSGGVDRIISLLQERASASRAAQTTTAMTPTSNSMVPTDGPYPARAEEERTEQSTVTDTEGEITVPDDWTLHGFSGEDVKSDVSEVETLRQFIAGKQASKEWRRFWCATVGPRAAYQEWPEDLRERFDATFTTIIGHPKFLSNLVDVSRTFRNGAVIGNEQFYRMAVVIAGSCALYHMVVSD